MGHGSVVGSCFVFAVRSCPHLHTKFLCFPGVEFRRSRLSRVLSSLHLGRYLTQNLPVFSEIVSFVRPYVIVFQAKLFLNAVNTLFLFSVHHVHHRIVKPGLAWLAV